MRTKLGIPAVLLAVLALGAACGNDDEGDDDRDSSSEETSETTTEDDDEGEAAEAEATVVTTEATVEESNDTAPAPSGDVTAPGTELAIGDTAVLPLTYGTEGTATVEVTVTGITEGTSQDLVEAQVEEAQDYTPFYIQIEMEILEVGPKGFGGYTPGSDFDGLIGDQDAGTLIVFGDFGPCESGGFEYDSAVGDTATSCVPALATKGSVVDGAKFSGGTEEYDQFDGEPVVWQ